MSDKKKELSDKKKENSRLKKQLDRFVDVFNGKTKLRKSDEKYGILDWNSVNKRLEIDLTEEQEEEIEEPPRKVRIVEDGQAIPAAPTNSSGWFSFFQ